jgi:hypothetical protein
VIDANGPGRYDTTRMRKAGIRIVDNEALRAEAAHRRASNLLLKDEALDMLY